MRVLVVGSGAREHAFAWSIVKDRAVREVIVAPGNGGTSEIARNVAVAAHDVPALVALAKSERVGLVVVGPEAPLVAGLGDAMRRAGIPVFGPSERAAQLEGSKVFTKELLNRAAIPTADYEVFDDADAADAYVRQMKRPLVVKADGLAAGKGVVVAQDEAEALSAIDAMMRQRVFGEAGARIVIEETLVGEEVSYHVVSDGERFVPLAPAQDHKRALDGDRGPNTGGMGAYSRPPVFDEAMERRVLREIVEPTLSRLAQEGIPFRGALFVGLMITREGPKVLEFNVRFGDPECEVMLARLSGSVFPLLHGAASGDLRGVELAFSAPSSLAVVLAAPGYPGEYPKGARIEGLAQAEAQGAVVFHAGTTRDASGAVSTAGGRVLAVTATGDGVDQAAERAYRAAACIRFDGAHYRRDIGHRARKV